jgi:hypothetical protein
MVQKRWSARVVVWTVGLAGLLASCGQQAPTEQLVAVDPSGQSRDLRLLRTLKPGDVREIKQKLDVNVVFIGYEQGKGDRAIDAGTFRAGLPQQYRAVNRVPSFYLTSGKEITGNAFSYKYNVTFARQNFEDRFFQYLSSIAVKKPLSLFQNEYNKQVARSLTIPADGGYWIDAPKVEKWLAQNAPHIGINTRNYTTFFINWYGRKDFKFHVYTKTDEPDPDTGYNFGELRSSRKMIAWGGTTPDDKQNGLGSLNRIWFHDLSAGPESNTGQYDIDNADLDGDDALDYRMPPIWEYGNKKGYRPFTDLSGDLSKVMRYVAINLLFTTSPLYRVQITPPEQPERLQVNVNMFEGDAASSGLNFVKAGLMNDNLNALQPLNKFTTDLRSRPIGDAQGPFRCYSEQPGNAPCDVPGLGVIPSGLALFGYGLVNRAPLSSGTADYMLPVLAFNLDSTYQAPFLGLADDDYLTGTQSFVYAVASTAEKAAGYGFTTTLIHEVGHHLGMSHPHDGYDFETDTDYGPSGDTFYAWAGDESNSMMSYIDLNWDFSQFDRDNMNRYLVAGYINNSNQILGKFAATNLFNAPIEAFVSIFKADAYASVALQAYQAMEYSYAASFAKKGYAEMSRAAKLAKVNLEPFLWYQAFEEPAAAAGGPSSAKLTMAQPNPIKEYAEDSDVFEQHRNMP